MMQLMPLLMPPKYHTWYPAISQRLYLRQVFDFPTKLFNSMIQSYYHKLRCSKAKPKPTFHLLYAACCHIIVAPPRLHPTRIRMHAASSHFVLEKICLLVSVKYIQHVAV